MFEASAFPAWRTKAGIRPFQSLMQNLGPWHSISWNADTTKTRNDDSNDISRLSCIQDAFPAHNMSVFIDRRFYAKNSYATGRCYQSTGSPPTPRLTVSGTLTLSALLLEPPGGFSNDRISQPMEKCWNLWEGNMDKNMEHIKTLCWTKKTLSIQTTTSAIKMDSTQLSSDEFLWLLTFAMQSTMPWYLTHTKVGTM